MSKLRVAYSMKIGAHRIPFMQFRESEKGDQYVIFPLNPRGFHISIHQGAHPHMKDRTGFRQDLNLDLLRRVDWNEEAERFRRDLETRAYWPSHRADIVAFPGPRGKSYFEALRDLAGAADFDLVRYLKLILGSGTIFKVGPQEREEFFRSKVGQGAFLFDKKEGCFAAYLPIFPAKPLLRFGGKFGTMPLHPHLQAWTSALDAHLDLEEEMTTKYELQIEEDFGPVSSELEAFARKLRVIRWTSRRRTKKSNRSPSMFAQEGATDQ